MDLTHDRMPPPIGHPRESSTAGLLRALHDLEATVGHPIPTKILPGALPALDVTPEALVATCMHLRDQLGFNLLSCVSGADMLEYRIVAYHVRNLTTNWLLQLTVRVPESNEVPTVMSVWPTANWLERETFDLFGIIFTAHPDLRRILLDDEFGGHPLLKSFRPTPLTRHDAATTQIDPQRAVSGESQRGLGPQRAISNPLSQGDSERLHPGTPTFGSTQFHGRDFPPQTWKHTLAGQQEDDGTKTSH